MIISPDLRDVGFLYPKSYDLSFIVVAATTTIIVL